MLLARPCYSGAHHFVLSASRTSKSRLCACRAHPKSNSSALAAQPLVAAVVRLSSGQLQQLPPWLLVSLLQACALTEHRPPAAWLSDLYAALQERSPLPADQSVAALTALSALHPPSTPPTQWLHAALALELPSLTTPALLLWLHAAAALPPSLDGPTAQAAWLDLQLRVIYGDSAPHLDSIVSLLTAAAVPESSLPAPPDSLAAAVLGSLSHSVGTMPLADLAATLRALTRLHRLCPLAPCPPLARVVEARLLRLTPSSSVEDSPSTSRGSRTPPDAACVALLSCLSSLSHLSPGPLALSDAASSPAAAALAPSLAQLDPVQLIELVASLVRLRGRPDAAFAASFQSALQGRLTDFESDDLVELLRQLHAIGCCPTYRWLDEVAAAASNAPASPASANGDSSGSSGSSSSSSSAQLASGSSPSGGQSDARALVLALFLPACLGHVLPPTLRAACVACLRPHLAHLSPADLTNALWALACMEHTPEEEWMVQALQAVDRLVPRLSPLQLAFLLGALQKLQRPVPAALVDTLLDTFQAGLRGTPETVPGDVVLVLATVARLQHITSYAWTDAITDHLLPLLPRLSARELATTAWALAKLHHHPSPEWWSALLDSALPLLPTCPPDSLAALLWAAAEVGPPVPPAPWLEAACAAAGGHIGRGEGFEPQDLVSLLSALAAMGHRPDAEWLAQYLMVMELYGPLLEADAFGEVVHSLEALDVRLDGSDWLDIWCRLAYPKLRHMTPASLTDLGVGLQRLGCTPPQAWRDAFAVAMARCPASAFSPEQRESLVCCMAAWDVPAPPQLLAGFFQHSAAALGAMTPDRMIKLVTGIAKLKPAPDPAWVDGLVPVLRSSLGAFTLVQLSALTKALVELKPAAGQPVSDLLAVLREFFLY